jgi:acetone carboxylase gamma subunit
VRIVLKLNDYLSIEDRPDGPYIVCRCGHPISRADENYKLKIPMRVVPLATAGPHVNPNDIGPGRFALREFTCPSCLTLLDVEVALRHEPPRWDVQLDVP